MTILIISDNKFLIEQLHELINERQLVENYTWEFVCSPNNNALLNDKTLPVALSAMHVKSEYKNLAGKYDLVLSLHCKQLFPAEMVKSIRCINVHPGYNPHNRGWFPQVFSILNNKKAGASIHEIDEQLDHGAIICQQEVQIEKWDTSLTAYLKIQDVEVQLLRENLTAILEGNYKTHVPIEEGNINLKKDFDSLCKIDLEKHVTMSKAIDYLRALTHGNYKNGYFIDENTGKKIYVTISLTPE